MHTHIHTQTRNVKHLKRKSLEKTKCHQNSSKSADGERPIQRMLIFNNNNNNRGSSSSNKTHHMSWTEINHGTKEQQQQPPQSNPHAFGIFDAFQRVSLHVSSFILVKVQRLQSNLINMLCGMRMHVCVCASNTTPFLLRIFINCNETI